MMKYSKVLFSIFSMGVTAIFSLGRSFPTYAVGTDISSFDGVYIGNIQDIDSTQTVSTQTLTISNGKISITEGTIQGGATVLAPEVTESIEGNEGVAGKWVYHSSGSGIVVYIQNNFLYRYTIIRNYDGDSLEVSYCCPIENDNRIEQYFTGRFRKITSIRVSEDKSRDKISPYIEFQNDVIEQVTIAKENKATVVEVIAPEGFFSFTRDTVYVLSSKEIDVSLTYTYLEHQYHVLIPAGYDTTGLVNEEGYCGFMYLAKVFGATLMK